jgi:hypothetical protein
MASYLEKTERGVPEYVPSHSRERVVWLTLEDPPLASEGHSVDANTSHSTALSPVSTRPLLPSSKKHALHKSTNVFNIDIVNPIK